MLKDEGNTQKDIARSLGVSEITVQRYYKELF